MPCVVSRSIDPLFRIVLFLAHVRPPKLDFVGFIEGLDLREHLTKENYAELTKLGSLRKLGLTVGVYTWTRVALILGTIDAQHDALAKSAKDVIEANKLLHDACKLLQGAVEIQRAAPGLWIDSARRNEALLDRLIALVASEYVQPTSKMHRKDWRRRVEYLILSWCITCVRNYADPIKDGDPYSYRFTRMVLGPALNLPATVIWEAIRAGERASNLHPTDVATLAQRYRRFEDPSNNRLSSLFDEHIDRFRR